MSPTTLPEERLGAAGACCSSVTVSQVRPERGGATVHVHGDAVAVADSGRLQAALEAVGPGDHLCLVYETQEEQFAAAMPYMRLGLARGERCIYIADDNNATTILDTLRAEGVDVEAAQASGQLLVVTKREAYLQQGHFDPDWMIRFLAAATAQALQDGYPALRVTGEMTWALGSELGVDRLMEYEAKLNQFFRGAPASAICQYNATRFRPEVVEEAIYTHPLVVYGDQVCRNHYYVPPEEYIPQGDGEMRVKRILRNMLARENRERELERLKEELERRVQERTRQLAAANRELESFAYSVSHDLRAPLRGIDYFSRVLEEDCGDKLDSLARDYLSRVRSESQRLTHLVDGMLSLSRATEGSLSIASVDLSRLAREVVTPLQREDPGRAVTVSIEDGLVVKADPRLMRAVLENLLGNAWKFTGNTEHACISLTCVEEAGNTVYVVRDNGAGFDMGKVDRLFGAFQRLHDQSAFEGTGVGLATVKRIVERHGGKVWAEGRVNEGAAFSFTLPSA